MLAQNSDRQVIILHLLDHTINFVILNALVLVFRDGEGKDIINDFALGGLDLLCWLRELKFHVVVTIMAVIRKFEATISQL